MAKLSSEERAALKRLQEKAEAPDAPPMGRNVNFSIDLGDPKQVARAQKMGLIDADDDGDDDAGGDDDDDDADETPNRRSYFKERKK